MLNPVRYARFAWALEGFFRHRLTLEEAKASVRRRVDEREANFLSLVERTIFRNRASPYLPLFEAAGCSSEDLHDLVETKGLEPALRVLREAGVYVTFEEFKGKTPIVRNGQTAPVSPKSFDNPLLTHYHVSTSGGTTGLPTRFHSDLTHEASRAAQTMVTYDAHGILGAPSALWRGTLWHGISHILRGARFGHVPVKWFSPITSPNASPPPKDKVLIRYVTFLARMHGLPVPRPQDVNLNDAGVIARWARDTLDKHGACVISCHVSPAVRVAVAAQELGIDLTGATFIGGGEPPTPAKVRAITGSGARWVPTYSFSECGSVGFGCANPVDGNDIHLFKDGLALIQYPRRVPGWEDITIDAFHFTSLLPTAPKILLNVESDDYGIVETRACGCPLETYGFTEHIRHIFSFRKLTSEGSTFVGTDMIRILDEVLPARFGGTPLDYQLVEEEDERGLTRLTLLASPRLRIADETALIATVLEGLGTVGRSLWKDANTIRVRRKEPIWTDRGKLMPLNLKAQMRSSR